MLLVEGRLELEVWGAILAGSPAVNAVPSSKYALKSRAQTARRERQREDIFYLRDRDFDFDPPQDPRRPQPETDGTGRLIGWHWSRHEIENYLLEPGLVAAALGWDLARYSESLCEAARRIRHYQAARWTVGKARRTLPLRPYELPTKPVEVGDDRLPTDLSMDAVNAWAVGHCQGFCDKFQQALQPDRLRTSLEDQTRVLTAEFLAAPANALLWCAGKDLLAALRSDMETRRVNGAGAFRSLMRDWIRRNPDAALTHLPEWCGFKRIVQAEEPATS
jgi:hypothetical protein